MIDRDRVGQLVCQPGDRVGIELGFLWNSEPRMVAAHFRKFVGSRYSARRDLGEQISLEGGGVRHVVEGGESYASVELSGVVPGSIDPGTYHCRYVHFLIPGRGWVLVFENLHLTIRVVDGPPAHREREGARLFGVRFLG
jgi:hypothetical protein